MNTTITPALSPSLESYNKIGRPSSGGGVRSFSDLMTDLPRYSAQDSVQKVGDLLRASETAGIAYLQGKSDSTTLTRATTEASQALELLKNITEKVVDLNNRLNQML